MLISGSSVPRRRRTAVPGALLTTGQFNSYPGTTQRPVQDAAITTQVWLPKRSKRVTQLDMVYSTDKWLNTFRPAHEQHLLHLWDPQTLRKQSLGGFWLPTHCGGDRSSRRTFPTQSCFHCCPGFQHTLYSQGGSLCAW